MPRLSTSDMNKMFEEYNNGSKPVDLIKKYNISRGTFFTLKKKHFEKPEYDEITVDKSYDNKIEETDAESESEEVELNKSSESSEESKDLSFGEKIKNYKKNININDVVKELDELQNEKFIKLEPNRNEQSFKPEPPEKFKIEVENKTNEKETLDLKRKLIRQIKNYSKEFEPHLKYLIGNTEPQQKKWIDSLANKSNDELIIIRDEISYAISSKNSNNMLKIAYLYGMGFVENVGTNYLDLRLKGLQQTLAQNRDLDLIMKELSCMYNLNLFNDPRARLIMLTGMTILSIDTKNRLIEEYEQSKQTNTNTNNTNLNDTQNMKETHIPSNSNIEKSQVQNDEIDNILNKIKI